MRTGKIGSGYIIILLHTVLEKMILICYSSIIEYTVPCLSILYLVCIWPTSHILAYTFIYVLTLHCLHIIGMLVASWLWSISCLC